MGGGESRVPVDEGGYLAKMATILEGDMVNTEEIKELM